MSSPSLSSPQTSSSYEVDRCCSRRGSACSEQGNLFRAAHIRMCIPMAGGIHPVVYALLRGCKSSVKGPANHPSSNAANSSVVERLQRGEVHCGPLLRRGDYYAIAALCSAWLVFCCLLSPLTLLAEVSVVVLVKRGCQGERLRPESGKGRIARQVRARAVEVNTLGSIGWAVGE